LLTGYCDPPAGVTVPEGMHYNPYFPGGLISMAKSLFNEVIEYEDGKDNVACISLVWVVLIEERC
jgi:ubiquinol-cytochrome c reductase cytochrome c1 subunit